MKQTLKVEVYRGKSSKTKIFIIILIALVIFAGIIFAVYKIAGQEPEKNVATTTAPEKKEQKTTKKTLVADKFELPVEGATGFASVSMSVKGDYNNSSPTIMTLDPGDGFCILSEHEDWWEIEREGETGWVDTKYCMINLPDIIPSIVYDNYNSYSSEFRSSRKDIPGLTGEKLYDAMIENDRFDEELPLMPVIYTMAEKIYEAQQSALENDESLLIVESYRPHETQRKVVTKLSSLMASDSEVNAGINKSPWSQSWFISTGTSNHQRGIAIDVTLTEVIKTKKTQVGSYTYNKITEHEQFEMPSPIHELSTDAVSFTRPFDPESSAWKNTPLSDNMNEAAKRLQKYCTDTGLTPLASEWWHFDDPESSKQVSGNKSSGNYFIEECFSRI